MIDEEIAEAAARGRRPTTRCSASMNQIESSFYNRMERVGGFGGKADQLNAYYTEHRRSRLVQRGSRRATARCRRPTSAPRRTRSCPPAAASN